MISGYEVTVSLFISYENHVFQNLGQNGIIQNPNSDKSLDHLITSKATKIT